MARRIEAKVYEPDASTLVRTLDEDEARSWLDDGDDVGFGSVVVETDGNDEAELYDGRIVKMFLDGTARFAWLVEQTRRTTAGPERQSARLVNVSGRGLLAVLEWAVVYPELPLGLRSPETRFFSFASADFDDSGWSNAVELKQQSDPAGPWSGAPANWQDPDAYWIGVTGDEVPGVAPGERYFRKTFTIASGDEGDFIISIACDDTWQLYVDGDLLAQSIEVGAWMQNNTIELPLDAGTHTIAVACSNLTRPNPLTNVFGFIFSLAPLEFGATPIVSSDASWKVNDGGAGVPGMFVGDILDVLLTEAQTRGCFPDLTWDFTDLLDSNGDPWLGTIDVSFPVQTSYLDVVKHLIDEHACEIWMTHDLVLHAAPRRGTDLTGSVELAYADNVARLKHTRHAPGANTILALSVFGRWFETQDAGSSIGFFGRREIGLSLGSAPSLAAVVRQTEAFFTDHSMPAEILDDVQVEEVTGAIPYTDWGVGDVVTAPDYWGSPVDYRVAALSVSEDDAGQPIFTPELAPE